MGVAMNRTVLVERVERKILLIRGHKVMLDSSLAELYGVPTKVFNQAVRRNIERFPEDFMFELSWKEAKELSRSQIVTLKRGKNIKYRPRVFTEQGVAMLSSILRSKRAIQVNIAIMRAFVKLRHMLAGNKELATKLAELERKLEGHDQQIHSLFDAIRQLMTPPVSPRRRVGFHVERP